MLFRNIRYALRTLLSTPGFSSVAILSLALGIGVNSAMFSGADALLLRPLEVPRASEVVAVNGSGEDTTNGLGGLSYPDYVDLRAWSTSFKGLLAFTYRLAAVKTQPNTLPELREGMAVSANFFRALEVEPVVGRGFLAEEEDAPVIVLSNSAWERLFAADTKIVGHFIRLNDIEFQIIGVAPKQFNGIDTFVHPDFYFPIKTLPRVAGWAMDELEKRTDRWFRVKGRLKPTVNRARASIEMTALARRLTENYPKEDRNRGLVVRTEFQLHAVQAPQHVALSAMLLGIAGLVLILSCTNVANLLLGRARARAREMAVRLAIGAGRGHLVGQLLTESMILALAGGALGLLLARAGVDFLQKSLSFSADLPIYLIFRLDERVLLFSLAAAVGSALAFGLAPAIETTRVDLVPALKSGESKGSGRRSWGRNALVAAQVALALMLLSGEAMFIRTFGDMALSNPGFRTDRLVMMTFDPKLIHYTNEKCRDFYKTLVERARQLPGVRHAALSAMVPVEYIPGSARIAPEGFQFAGGSHGDSALTYAVGDQYFETMGTSVLRGRGFRQTDTAASPHVAVINDVMAARYWPRQSPIGKRFRVGDENGPWVEVVGVAQTTWYAFVGENRSSFFYTPLAQNSLTSLTLLVETASDDAAGWEAPLLDLVHSINARLPVFNIRTMHVSYEQRGLQTLRLVVRLVGAMGLLGLVLALIGLYALVAYSVSRRTREIGIRMAVGADRLDILQMVLRQGLTLALMGTAVGAVGSVGLIRGIRALFTRLEERGIFDPWTFVAMPLALLAVTMIASYIPARRAARIDPNRALHEE